MFLFSAIPCFRKPSSHLYIATTTFSHLFRSLDPKLCTYFMSLLVGLMQLLIAVSFLLSTYPANYYHSSHLLVESNLSACSPEYSIFQNYSLFSVKLVCIMLFLHYPFLVPSVEQCQFLIALSFLLSTHSGNFYHSRHLLVESNISACIAQYSI